MLAERPDQPLPLSRRLERIAYRSGDMARGTREIAEETAVALSYGGSTYAVMMATPGDLEDFAVGFSLTEQIITSPSEIEALDVVPAAEGIDIQMWLTGPRDEALSARRRYLTGPTGCGLCGIDSLAEAMRTPLVVGDSLRIGAASVLDAMSCLSPLQALNRRTGAAHAAAFWKPEGSLLCLREDVGRHNALDKLVGALARSGHRGAEGVLLLTSRISVEMVQKAAVLGSEIIVAISAPTSLAIRTAEQSRITLIAVARADGFEVFTHPHRLLEEA
jgi:FdhD protein